MHMLCNLVIGYSHFVAQITINQYDILVPYYRDTYLYTSTKLKCAISADANLQVLASRVIIMRDKHIS